MGKVFGILLIVLAIWVGLEVMNNGTAGAFDGAFVRAGLVSPEEAVNDVPLGSRASGAVERAHRKTEDRLAEFD